MSKSVIINGKEYTNASEVNLETTDGGTALFRDVDEIVTPTGTKTITTNGTHDVKNYATAVVNVETGGGSGEAQMYADILSGNATEINDSLMTKIRVYSFKYYYGLTSLKCENVTEVDQYGVDNCGELLNVDLPKCVAIRAFAFNGCKNLASVNLPVCETLGESAFYLCSALTEIMLPKCTEIGKNAFGFCTSLTKLTLGSPTMCVLEGINAFRDINKTVTIEVPADLVATYQADSVWSAVTGATLEFVAIS